MSLTQWLTRSAPTVSKRPTRRATMSLVPTPSVLETSTGSFIPPKSARNSEPKLPMPVSTCGPWVERARAATVFMARVLRSMSTPASL
jgi:hypothetical protein